MGLARTFPPEALQRAREQGRPVVLAGEQVLPVLGPLEPLFPEHGLRRGSTVSVDGGPGATSLALALGAAASAAGSWVAGVGLPALGLMAAAELGVSLERVVVVSSPPPQSWATVVAALLDAVDLVWAGLPGRVAAGDARRLAARARERGSVLVPLAGRGPGRGRAGPGGTWPVPAEVRLTVGSSSWAGPASAGAGRLEARRVEVVTGGRGAAARPRRVRLWLPGADGTVSPASPSELCRVLHTKRASSDREREG